MSARLKILLVVVALVAVAVATPFAYRLVTDHLKIGLDAGDDPYAGVTIVHRQLPPSTLPDEWAQRLETQAGTGLGLAVRQDWRPGRGDGGWLGATRFQRTLAKAVTLPNPRDYRVMGVVSNAQDPAAVAAHGALYLLWFQTPVDADNWLRSHPRVFADARQEAKHATWWAGFDVVYYAPPAHGKDLTGAVDHWVRSVTACPDDPRGCVIPQHLATAGAKPTDLD